MPYSYLTLKRQAALRLAQIKGSDQATLEAAYSGAWATALDGAEIPKSAFKDLILMIGKEIAQAIGNNAAHPARSFLYGRTANLADLAAIPTVDQNGVEFVGIFDSAADSSDNAPLTFQPTETLADYADPFFDDTELYNFNTTGNQFRHTRPLAYLQGCIWSQSAQSTLYDNDGDCPLPEACANMHVNGVVANSGQVGWVDGASLVSVDNALYQSGFQMLLTGLPNIPLASQAGAAG